jgi:hypothetical protein
MPKTDVTSHRALNETTLHHYAEARSYLYVTMFIPMPRRQSKSSLFELFFPKRGQNDFSWLRCKAAAASCSTSRGELPVGCRFAAPGARAHRNCSLPCRYSHSRLGEPAQRHVAQRTVAYSTEAAQRCRRLRRDQMTTSKCGNIGISTRSKVTVGGQPNHSKLARRAT